MGRPIDKVTIDGEELEYKFLVTKFKTLLDQTDNALKAPIKERNNLPEVGINGKNYNLIDLIDNLPQTVWQKISKTKGLNRQTATPIIPIIAKSSALDPGIRAKAASLKLKHAQLKVEEIQTQKASTQSPRNETAEERRLRVEEEAKKRIAARRETIAKKASSKIKEEKTQNKIAKQEAMQEWARDLKAFSRNINVRARVEKPKPFQEFEEAIDKLSTETEAMKILQAYVKAGDKVQKAYKSQKLAQAQYAQKFFNSPKAEKILQDNTTIPEPIAVIKNAEISDKNARLISARFTRLCKANPLIEKTYESWFKDQAAKRKAMEVLVKSNAGQFAPGSRANLTPPDSGKNSPQTILSQDVEQSNDTSKGESLGHMTPSPESANQRIVQTGLKPKGRRRNQSKEKSPGKTTPSTGSTTQRIVQTGLKPKGRRMKQSKGKDCPAPPPTPPNAKKVLKNTGHNPSEIKI